MRVCICVCLCVCAHIYSDCEDVGGGCLPVCDSEQRAGGLGMEQRICIDCFCASELFSRCQSCLHQLRGKLQHLHQEAFSFLFKKNLFFFYFTMGAVSKMYCVRGCSCCLSLSLNKTGKIKSLMRRPDRVVFSWPELWSRKTHQKFLF